MKKTILILLSVFISLTLLAQETPPAGLKPVNSQFYIHLPDSSIWQNKGTPYGYHRVEKYGDALHKTGNISETISGYKTFTSPVLLAGNGSDGSQQLQFGDGNNLYYNASNGSLSWQGSSFSVATFYTTNVGATNIGTTHLSVSSAPVNPTDVARKKEIDSLGSSFLPKSNPIAIGTANIPRVNVGDSTINQTIVWRGNSQHLAVKRADVVSNSQSYAYLVSQAMGYRQVNQGWGGRTDQQSTAAVDSSLFYTVTKLPLPYFKPGTIYVLGVFANDITNDTTHYTPALWQAQMTAVVDTIQAHGALVVFQNPGYEGGYLGYANHSLDMESRHSAYYAAMQNVAMATGCLYYDDWSAMKPNAAQYVTTIDFIHITVAGNLWEAGRFAPFLQSHFTSHPWVNKNNVYGNVYIEGNQVVQNSITTNQLNVTGGAVFPFVEINGQLHSRNADHSGNTSNFVAGGDITGHTVTNGVNKSGNVRGYIYADTTDFLPMIGYSSTVSQSILYIGYDSKTKYNPTDIIFAVSATPTSTTSSIPAVHIFPSGGTTISTVTETDPGAGNFRITGSLLFKNDNLSIIGSAAMNAATVYSRIFRSGSTLTLNAGGSNVLIGTSGTGQVTLPFYTTAGILHNSTSGLITSGKATSSDVDATIMTTSTGRIGQVVLVAGTKSISITGVTTSSLVFVSLVSVGGTVATTWHYAGVCTAGTLTISALTNSNTTNTADTSIINYQVIN